MLNTLLYTEAGCERTFGSVMRSPRIHVKTLAFSGIDDGIRRPLGGD